MIDLGTLGGLSSFATGINDADQVVGYSFRAVAGYTWTAGIAATHAFLYSNGRMADLGTLGGPTSSAAGINALGQVTGTSYTAVNSTQHAFLYSGGKMIDLGTLGGTNSTGAGISALGQVVGNSMTAGDNAFHAFLYSGGPLVDLGTLGGIYSAALGVNALGQVVGESDTAVGGEHAWFWEAGMSAAGERDLNDLIPAGSGWELNHATAVSDGGEITGTGTINGAMHAFLLTPTGASSPAPAAVNAALAALDQLAGQLTIPATATGTSRLRLQYLTTRLQAAHRQLELSHPQVAINQLRCFIAIASGLTSQDLPATQRQALLDGAQAIITQLGG
jgi:probable HAF family extracellular repeat protein